MREQVRFHKTATRHVVALVQRSTIAASIAVVLHGPATGAEAGIDAPAPNPVLEEIVVTANRRTVAISKAPYNISAYSGNQLEAANITTLNELSQQVPNLVIEDSGARASVSEIPIIRGLNASQPAGLFDGSRFFESPVGFYLSNSPMIGALPLMDVERVEVLRGPQGTLYGSGTLAGAVRVVPFEPRLASFGGEVSGAAAHVSHSNSPDWDVFGMVNLPLGETIAVRLDLKDQFDAGFINQRNIMRREGDNYVNGVPLLANPSDVAFSPAVYFDKNNVNWTRTVAPRATLLWKPTDEFKLVATYNYSHVFGNNSPTDNHSWAGGPSPIDPRVTLAPTGNYEISSTSLEPFDRTTTLASLDASYDVGFATLSGTLSYGKTHGENVIDATRGVVGIPYAAYYTGIPATPRFAETYQNIDNDKAYTEEVRLVSNGKHTVEYVLGLFAQQEERFIGFNSYDPGADVASAAANGGDTTPVYLGGGYVPLLANNALLLETTNQSFRDLSLYGNLTWNVNAQWQISGGARVFHQSFSEQQRQILGFVQTDNSYPEVSKSVTSHIFSLNTSYELSAAVKTYATWSQGFRRGGANSFALSGPTAENPDLLYYAPDKTDNFELGLKGTAGGLYFSLAAFYVRWTNPQIDLLTPYFGYNAVVNGKEATSKGFEFETSGPLGLKGLSFNAGLAYAKARLSKDFALASNDSSGVEPNGIVGHAGDRLPGAPDWSGTLNLNYRVKVSEAASVTIDFGADYRGSTTNDLPNLNPIAIVATAPSYTMLHGDIGWDMERWRVTLYGTNLANRYVVYSSGVLNTYSVAAVGTYTSSYTVARPRVLGLRVNYRW